MGKIEYKIHSYFISDSTLRGKINQAILEIYYDGTLSLLKGRWFRNQNIGCKVILKKRFKRVTVSFQKNTPQLDFENIGGIFIILSIGIVIAFLTLSLEMIISKQK